MMQVRRSEERGRAQMGWLDSHHTFSFGNYYDPEQMGFGPLRVINEDRVTPGQGFGTHGHKDMEIISYVLSGALRHEDSMGNGSVIRPGDVQIMSAGTGVLHSEMNPSDDEGVHFLQIWIIPERSGLTPCYQQQSFTDDEKRNHLKLVGSGDGRDGSVHIHRDVDLYSGLLSAGETVRQTLDPARHAWLQIASGEVELNSNRLSAGDGVALHDENEIVLACRTDAEVLLFDMG